MRLRYKLLLRLGSTMPLLLLVAGASLAAEQGTRDTPAVLMELPPSQGCPVLFSADVRAAGRLDLATTPGPPKPTETGPPKPATTVELSFARADGPAVREVDVTLHGLAGEARVVDAAGARPDAGGGTAQSFRLVPVTARDGAGHAELEAVALPIVTWAELTRIRYADGTSWTPKKGTRCSAAPHGLQPVATAR